MFDRAGQRRLGIAGEDHMTTRDDERRGATRLVDGFKRVDPKRLAEFRRVMEEEVVPSIVEAVEERRLRAARSREQQLKC